MCENLLTWFAWCFLLIFTISLHSTLLIIYEDLSIVLGVLFCFFLFFSNGKMWTCSGSQRITAASKRSEFPLLTFGGLIWFSTISKLCNQDPFAQCFPWPCPTLKKQLPHLVVLSSVALSQSPDCGMWKLIFHWAKSGLCIDPLSPYAACDMLPPPDNWRAERWLAGARHQRWPLLGHWCPLTFNSLSPILILRFLCPQCRRRLRHRSRDQSASGAHRNDHMEPTGHLQELLRNHRAAFPLWPPEL